MWLLLIIYMLLISLIGCWVQVIYNLYHNVKSCVKSNGKMSDYFDEDTKTFLENICIYWWYHCAGRIANELQMQSLITVECDG